jgi:hypothetical protein
MSDWYDTLTDPAPNLQRLVAGLELTVDARTGWTPDGPVTEPRTLTVEKLCSVTVGVDSDGIFAGLNVLDEEGCEWTLYSDGSVADSEDVTVGKHGLKSLPVKVSA